MVNREAFYGTLRINNNYHLIMTSIVENMCAKRYVPLFDYDTNGNFVFIKTVDIDLLKECPNCYTMFVKSENIHYVRKEDGSIVSFFYRCPACSCRIRVNM